MVDHREITLKNFKQRHSDKMLNNVGDVEVCLVMHISETNHFELLRMFRSLSQRISTIEMNYPIEIE